MQRTSDEPVHSHRPITAKDGTTRLCRALYRRAPSPRDYLGGCDARMLHEAAERIWLLEDGCEINERSLDEADKLILSLIADLGEVGDVNRLLLEDLERVTEALLEKQKEVAGAKARFYAITGRAL